MNAVQMLLDDHLRLQGLFRRFEAERDRTSRTRKDSARQALLELEVHGKLEEEIFYPAVREAGAGGLQKSVNRSFREHGEVDALLEELSELDPESERFEAEFRELMDLAERHMAEEENELFPAAYARVGSQLDELGTRMGERRRQILAGMMASDPGTEALLLGRREPEPAGKRQKAERHIRTFPTGVGVGAREAGAASGNPEPALTIRPGMVVVAQDGMTLGRVKEVRPEDFLLDRTMARDVYVPFDAVELVQNDLVSLNIMGHQLDAMGWGKPPLIA